MFIKYESTGGVSEVTTIPANLSYTAAAKDRALLAHVVGGTVALGTSDVEIGAVELKDADTDTRALIGAANVARNATDNVILMQAIDASGAVVGSSVVADTELPAAALLADATAYPTTPTVGAVLMGDNGTTNDMLKVADPTAAPGNVGVLATMMHVSDNTDIKRVFAPIILGDAINGNNMLSMAGWNWNGATYDRVIGDSTDGTTVNLGANNDVTLATLPDTATADLAAINALLVTIDADTSSLAGTVAGTELQVDIVAALPTGTNAIGKLAANSGVDIGDVDILSLPAVAHANSGATTMTVLTVAGVTASIDNSSTGYSKGSWGYVTTGAPSAVSITMEVSMDNTNWSTLGSALTDTTEINASFSDAAFPYIRFNLGTFTGGTNLTLTYFLTV